MKLLGLITLTLVVAAATSQAATLANAGSHLNIGEFIRSTGTPKPLDADGNNVFGTAGYYFASTNPTTSIDVNDVNDSSADYGLLTYLTIARVAGANAKSIVATNTPIDDPTAPTSATVPNVRSGINFFSVTTAELNTLTIGENFPAAGIRIGIFTDNDSLLQMASYTVRQTSTAGGSTATPVTFTIPLAANNGGNDFYFFDITNAVDGDVFTIAGTGTILSQTSYLGGLTVDVIPEPSSLMLVAGGALVLLGHRRRA